MRHQTIEAFRARSLAWIESSLIDWVSGGKIYRTDGTVREGHVDWGNQFDACIVSHDHRFAFMYGRLTTKGLLLKEGKLQREIDRSFYHADVYEFPVAFAEHGGRTILIHCPDEYNRIEFEDAESGERLTNSEARRPSDLFHSRFEVGTDNRYLLSKGWAWHPVDIVCAFDIPACIRDPRLLDESTMDPTIRAPLNTASFISASKVLIGSPEGEESFYKDEGHSPMPGEIAVWDLSANTISPSVKVQARFGDLYAIDRNRCWDLFKYPKIIDIRTGQVLDAMPELYSGERSSSIFIKPELAPTVSFNRETGQIAYILKGKIEVLSPD